MDWKIPLFKTYSDQDDIEAVSRVIQRGTYWACGKEIIDFENAVANYLGTKYVLAFNSGTSALHTLLLAHGITSGEVIVPSFTFVATANAVVLAGAKPVFAESEPETFGLDVEDVKKRITENTKAIMPLHYGGIPSRDIEKLRELADEKNILLIEEAAESFGASVNGKKVGTIGHSAMFSTCQNKVLATGEGGLLVTSSKDVYEKAKLIRSHGRVENVEDYFSSVGDNDYIKAGYNFRMPTVLAALGLSQFRKVQKIIDLRRSGAQYLNYHLSQIENVTVPKELPNHYQVYQMYTIRLSSNNIRDKLQKYLSDKGIMSKVYFNPVHLKTFFIKHYNYKEGDLPNTENLSNCVLNIPLYPNITQNELDYMITTIKEFFQKGF